MTLKTEKTLLIADSTNLVFEAFFKHIHENYLSEHGTQYFTFDVGSKYIRIWCELGRQRSSYCFVERSTGNVFKCATWKAPAKHPRGNLFDGIEDTTKYGVTKYGAEYLR